MAEVSVGISQIKIVVPETFIQVSELAEKRGLSPGFAEKGLIVEQARIPYNTSMEELAVEAIRKIEEYKEVKRFYLSTESDPDLSKPLAVTVINGMLGFTVVPVQNKFACLAGLQAVILACEYSVAHNGAPAIVISVDRSIYRKSQPEAEITQGCAAIAIKVEMNPQWLLLDYKKIGQYAEDIDDFKVPVGSVPFPEVDGPLTKPAYLYCSKWTVEDWKIANPGFGSILERLRYIIFHIPFTKMAEWAAAAIWHHEMYDEDEEDIGLEDCIDNPDLYPRYKTVLDKIRKEDAAFQQFFKEKIAPGLKYNKLVGNCYPGSVFLSLIAVLEQAKEGEEIGIAGYGSGAGSLAVRAIVLKDGFSSDLSEQLSEGAGVYISVDQYEEWRQRAWEEIWGDLSTTIELWRETLGPELWKETLKKLWKETFNEN